MRIGIDGTTICDATGSRGAGIEHYTWSMVFWLARVAPEHEFFVTVPSHFSRSAQEELTSGASNLHILRPVLPKISYLSRHLGLPTKFLFKKIDVLLGPAGQLPLGWRKKSVITVHDVSIFDHPEWFPEERARNFSTAVLVPNSIKHADKIIAVSDFTRKQLERIFPFSKGKITVVHEGVDVPSSIKSFDRDQLANMGLEDMVLYVGTIEPRKNITAAARAFEQFLHAHPDRARSTRFVLAGKRGWKTEETDRVIARVNAAWRERAGDDVIQMSGYVSEEEKWALLKHASALMLVSHEEGFGLPLIEALAVGTPVIASNRGSLPEIAGDATILVEPDDIEAMALAIAQCILVPDGARAMQSEGERHASQFTWEKAARETLRVIESATA